jgi:hypothetical protein
MKYLLWIFQSFGLKASVRYCWDTFWLKVRRAMGISPPVNFKGMSSDDLEDIRDSMNGPNKRILH